MKFYVGGNKIAGKIIILFLAGVLSVKMAFWLKIVVLMAQI